MATRRRKASDTYRFQAPSIVELVQGITRLRMECNVRGVKHLGRKIGDGPTLNALVAAALKEIPLDQLVEMVRRGNSYYENLLEQDPAESANLGADPLAMLPAAHTPASQPDQSARQGISLDPETGEPLPIPDWRGESLASEPKRGNRSA